MVLYSGLEWFRKQFLTKKRGFYAECCFGGISILKRSGYDLGVESIALDLPEYHPYTLKPLSSEQYKSSVTILWSFIDLMRGGAVWQLVGLITRRS